MAARGGVPQAWLIPPRLVTDDLSNYMSDNVILSMAVLSTALMFGGMTLFSFGFAAFLFRALPAKTAGEALRPAFPLFYTFVIAASAAAALLWWPRDAVFATVMVAVTITTVQILGKADERPTWRGWNLRFRWLRLLT